MIIYLRSVKYIDDFQEIFLFNKERRGFNNINQKAFSSAVGHLEKEYWKTDIATIDCYAG